MPHQQSTLSNSPARCASHIGGNPSDLFGIGTAPSVAVLDMPGPRVPDDGAKHGNTADEALPPSTPDAARAPGTPGEATAELWRGYWNACQRFEAEVEEYFARARLAEVDCRPSVPHTGLSGRLDLAERMALDLVRLASLRFRGPGCPPLKIREAEWVHRFVYTPSRDLRDNAQGDFFDPIALWAALEEEFGGEKGMELSYRDAGDKIRESFGLRPGVVVRRSRRGVTLVMPVWLGNTGYSLSGNTKERLIAVCDGLRAFAAWAEDDGTLFGGLDRLIELFGMSSYRPVNSREKIQLCASLSVVTYKTTFEFVLAAGLAEQLQLFLGLYAPVDLAATA